MFVQRPYNRFEIEIADAPPFLNTYSLDFDGVGDYVNCGVISALQSASQFTMSCWLNSSNVTKRQGVLKWFSTTTNWIELSITPTSELQMVIANGGTATRGVSASSIVLNDTWYNVAIIYNGSGATNADRLKIYLNGTDLPLTFTGTIPATTGTQNLNTFLIGERYINADYFVGNIDEVSIFDSAISIGDVWDGSGQPTDLSLLATPPVNWYRNGDNGAYKSPQWLIPSNENKDKVSNYSLEFDGVDDDFTSGDLSSLVDNKSKLSISFWVNLPDASEINRITGKYGGSLTKWLGVTCTSNKVSFVVSNIGSSLAYAETSAVLTDNTWHHVACIFDGTQATATDRIKIYIDNTDETFAFNGTLPTSTYDFTLEPTNPTWYVGQSGFQLGVNELRGKLNEYSIYSDVALTDLEVE